MLYVEVKLTDGTTHVIEDEESDSHAFKELIKYDTTNHFFRDIYDNYVSAKHVIKFRIRENKNGKEEN